MNSDWIFQAATGEMKTSAVSHSYPTSPFLLPKPFSFILSLKHGGLLRKRQEPWPLPNLEKDRIGRHGRGLSG